MSTRNNKAFTIIELIVVITAIAILASVAIVGYGNWRNDIRSSQIRNDLVAAASAMEDARSGQNGYPATIPTSFATSEGITVTLYETTPDTFCLDGNVSGGVQHYIDQSIVSEGPKSGTCAARTVSKAPSAPKNLQVVASSNSLELTWQASALTTSYQARCGTNSAISAGVVSQTVSAPTLTVTLSIPSAVPYFCQVLASNAAGQSPYSVTQVAVQPGGGEVPFAGYSDLALGYAFGCGIAVEGGGVYCWGENYYGELGIGSKGTNIPTPVPVNIEGTALQGKLPIKKITAGDYFVCVIASDDNPYCWGRNYGGQLGNGNTTDSMVAVAVNKAGVLNGKTVKEISAEGNGHVCVIASDNNAYCWGSNSTGALGNGTTTSSSTPVAVTTSGALSGKTIKQISAGGGATCAVASDNLGYCWGYDYYGTVGNGGSSGGSPSTSPVAVLSSGVLSGKTLSSIAVADLTACAITAVEQKVYCWGRDNYGQLGNGGTNSDAQSPVTVTNTGVLNGKMMAMMAQSGGPSLCGLDSDGRGYCWGFNMNGQLGNGGTSTATTPAAVSIYGVMTGKTLLDIDAGYAFACALANDSKIYCWGLGTYGRLGNGGFTQQNTPVLVSDPE